MANKIENLPDSFCNLQNLEGLRIHKNKLKKLPENFGNLKKLKELTLYKNLLTTLPQSFYELQFEKLNIAFNPLEIDKQKINSKWLLSDLWKN